MKNDLSLLTTTCYILLMKKSNFIGGVLWELFAQQMVNLSARCLFIRSLSDPSTLEAYHISPQTHPNILYVWVFHFLWIYWNKCIVLMTRIYFEISRERRVCNPSWKKNTFGIYEYYFLPSVSDHIWLVSTSMLITDSLHETSTVILEMSIRCEGPFRSVFILAHKWWSIFTVNNSIFVTLFLILVLFIF